MPPELATGRGNRGDFDHGAAPGPARPSRIERRYVSLRDAGYRGFR
jgi:hypothetical protein